MRKLKWLIINSSVVCLFSYVTMGEASVGAERILKFIFILAGTLSTFTYCNEDLRAKIHAKGRSVPAVLNHLLGAVYVLWLVYLGFWVTALFALLNEFMECGVYYEPEEEKVDEETLCGGSGQTGPSH